MHKYKVGYIAKDGSNRVFTFKSDRKMIVSSRNRSDFEFSFGIPWRRDMNKAIAELEYRDSIMKRCGGIEKFRYVENVDTGQFVETTYII